MLPFLFFLALVAHAYTVNPQELQQKNIFILAGQSNMVGEGGVVSGTWDHVVPPQCYPNPSILRLAANLTWVQAHEPLHIDIDTDKVTGVGPGMAFSNALLAKDPNFGVIGLVPCAVGGTSISEWAHGTSLYKKLVRRAQASLQNGGTIQAILWYQGESDTVSREDAESYKGKLEKFFFNIRTDLQSPMLPIIQVALDPGSGSGIFIETVREAQLGIDLLNLRTVDAKGLPLEPDGLHLTTPAQVRLGEVLADTFLQFLPNGPLPSPSPSSAPRRCSNFIFDLLILPILIYLDSFS